jgi:hypothetical protein
MSYTVYLNQKNIPQVPSKVFLKSATGTYALIPRTGTSEYTTTIISPTELGRYREVISLEYPDGTLDNLSYDLVVDQPGYVYEKSGTTETRTAGARPSGPGYCGRAPLRQIAGIIRSFGGRGA